VELAGREGNNRSLVKITPAHLELLSQQIKPDEAAGRTKVFVIGGENLLAETLYLWRDFAPGTRLINEYGPTETVVGCCVYEVRGDDPRRGSVPIGRPIANTQLYVLDPDMNPVPVGVMGELYIGGAGVARGYLNRPKLTQQKFLADPFSGRSGARYRYR
jgi:non-ribosomal peptide synthetase component F